ncbi:hypothetical protein SLAVM298S_03590 [Streptomyces lavendulae subsp. lavendulae]
MVERGDDAAPEVRSSARAVSEERGGVNPESDGTTFPGGRVLGCKACEQVFPDRSLNRVSDARARDVTFLLDRLTGDRPARRHSRLTDARHIGMAGHSIGGASAATAMAADPRVAAGVNMDGTFFVPLPEAGLGGRPFPAARRRSGAAAAGPGGHQLGRRLAADGLLEALADRHRHGPPRIHGPAGFRRS